ncbi:MAG: hypothetical protein HXY46_14410 [Syntrophaceae bacterium]|nr:hypothetical protein [Syntrophaceae bacterium]
MLTNEWNHRYGPYSRKKGKKRSHLREEKFLKRSYDWLKWKITESGDFSFRRPCLEH